MSPSIASVLAVAGVLAVPQLARADGALFDLGIVKSRVAVSDQTALDATLVRFAIRGDLDRHIKYLHIGVEAEEGTLSGTTHLPGGAIARTAPGTTSSPGVESPLEGNVLALKAFAGLHANAGPLRLGADFALGRRDAWVSSDLGTDVAGRKWETLAEVRSRVDLRMSPRWLFGVMVSSDLIEQRDVSVALLLSLDCTR